MDDDGKWILCPCKRRAARQPTRQRPAVRHAAVCRVSASGIISTFFFEPFHFCMFVHALGNQVWCRSSACVSKTTFATTSVRDVADRSFLPGRSKFTRCVSENPVLHQREVRIGLRVPSGSRNNSGNHFHTVEMLWPKLVPERISGPESQGLHLGVRVVQTSAGRTVA